MLCILPVITLIPVLHKVINKSSFSQQISFLFSYELNKIFVTDSVYFLHICSIAHEEYRFKTHFLHYILVLMRVDITIWSFIYTPRYHFPPCVLCIIFTIQWIWCSGIRNIYLTHSAPGIITYLSIRSCSSIRIRALCHIQMDDITFHTYLVNFYYTLLSFFGLISKNFLEQISTH